MAYNALNNLIDAYIYANGVQAITGQILNGVLKQMVAKLGSGYHLMGVAGPETTPEQNDFAMAYFAATAGEYTDFGGITIAAGEVAVLLTSGNGSWEKQTIYNVPTTTEDLENTAGFITNAVTDLVNYYTKTEIDELPNGEDIDFDEDGKLQFANRTYNAQQPNGMGYKILRKDATFASQVTDTNTIYEIRYPFALSANFTMPTGCVLRFDGGSISGAYTLTFANTAIEGNANITCDIAGTIDGLVHAEWFGLVPDDNSFDNGPIIQKVFRTFDRVVVSGTNYYCQTPIDLSQIELKSIFIYANLRYTTQNTSTAFLKLSGSACTLRIYGRVYGPNQNISADNLTERSIGVKFEDAYMFNVYISSVYGFYTNIEVAASNGSGSAYNEFTFDFLTASRIPLLLKGNGTGAVTSSVFRVGRITTASGLSPIDTAVQLDGDNVGFSDIVFEKLTIEGANASEPIKLRNVNYVTFKNIRNEQNYATLVYSDYSIGVWVGMNYGNLSVRTKEGTYCDIREIDAELVPYSPLANSILIPGGSNQRILFNAISDGKTQNVNYNPVYYSPVGFICPVTRKSILFTCAKKFRVTIVYYDSSYTKVTRSNDIFPSGTVTFGNSSKVSNGIESTSDATSLAIYFPTLPATVAYIGFFFSTSEAEGYSPDALVFNCDRKLIEGMVTNFFTLGVWHDYPHYGSTSQRPQITQGYRDYLKGFAFFDTTLGKTVYAKSFASDGTGTWVDATGATV